MFDNLIREHVMKIHVGRERRTFRLWLYGKIAVHLAVCDARGNFGKLEHVWLVTKRRTELI